MTDTERLVLLDSFNISTNANKVGLINGLRQPGQLRNQLPKSMLLTLFPLIKFVVSGLILQPRQSHKGCRPTRSWLRFLLAVYKVHHDK